MSPNRKFCRVIQGRTPDAPVVEQEAAWLDYIDLDPQAGG
jgi:hypothetical protein